MVTLHRPNSRPVAIVLAFLLASTGILSAISNSFNPAAAYAGAASMYKSEPQWYNGPVLHPVLDGNTMAFTTGWEKGGQFLYKTDLVTGKDLKISQTPVSPSVQIAVSGTRVGWTDVAQNKWQLRVFENLNYSTSLIMDTPNEMGKPSMSGSQIVWRESNNEEFNSSIRLYDLTAQQLHTIASGKWFSNPVISGTNVAWFETTAACTKAAAYRLCDPQNALWDLVLYETIGGTRQVIARGVDAPYPPALTSSRIVWSARTQGQYDLFQYDLSSGVTDRLTQNELIEAYPISSEGRIAYVGIPTGYGESVVHIFTIADRSDMAMPHKNASQVYVTISGDRAAWVETREDVRIYFYDFSAHASEKIDTDHDGLTFGQEASHQSDDMMKDTDGDGIPDTDEVVMFFTNPATPDSDGDGLSDYQELYLYKSNPMKFDTDGDGFNDGREVQNGYSPTNKSPKKIAKEFHYEWSAPIKK